MPSQCLKPTSSSQPPILSPRYDWEWPIIEDLVNDPALRGFPFGISKVCSWMSKGPERILGVRQPSTPWPCLKSLPIVWSQSAFLRGRQRPDVSRVNPQVHLALIAVHCSLVFVAGYFFCWWPFLRLSSSGISPAPKPAEFQTLNRTAQRWPPALQRLSCWYNEEFAKRWAHSPRSAWSRVSTCCKR